MKKTLLFAATALTLVFASCKKDDKTTSITLPSEDLGLGTARIEGLIKADFNAKNADFEPGDNIKILVKIETEDWYLNPNANTVYPSKFYEATTDGNGRFSVTVEVSNNGLKNVKVIIPEFLRIQQQNGGDKNYKWKGTVPDIASIQKNDNKVLDVVTLSGSPHIL
jgi:hypothetical protein